MIVIVRIVLRGLVSEVRKAATACPKLGQGIVMLDYLNLHYDIFGLLHDIPASCCLSFLISFISSDT